MSTPKETDRRRANRIRHRMVARFEVQGRTERGVVSNFSEIGLFLETTVPVPEGTAVTLHVGSGETLRISGHVVWQRPGSPRGALSVPGGVGLTLTAVPDSYLQLVQQMRERMSSLPRGMDERFEIYNRIRFQARGKTYVEYTENLSRGGVYIATEQPIDAGEILDIQLEIPGLEDFISVKGRVAYRLDVAAARERGRAPGLGVAFVGVSPDVRARIEHYITRLEVHRTRPERRRIEQLPASGSLTSYLIPEILLISSNQKRTGKLTLTRKGVTKSVYLKNGQPVYVESRERAETLGYFLQRNGKITQEQLAKSMEEYSKGDMRHGEVLLKMGIIEPSTLAEALVSHQEEKLTNTFPWFEGEYRFESDIAWPEDISIFPMGTHQLVLNGIRRWYDADLIAAWMGLHEECILKQVEEPPPEVNLPPGIVKLLRRIATPLSVGTLVKELKVPLHAVLQVAYFLIIAGWAKFEFQKLDISQPKFKRPIKDREPMADSAIAALKRRAEEDLKNFQNLDFYQLLKAAPGMDEVRLNQAFMERTAPYLSADLSQIEDAEALEKIQKVLSWLRLAYDTLRDPNLRQLYARRGAKKARAPVRTSRLEAERYLLAGVRDLEKKEFKNAIKNFELATRTDPEDPAHRGYLGWALFQNDPKENLKRSCQLLDEVIFADVADPQIYYYRGQVAVYLANWKQAERLFQRAVRLHPNFVEAVAAMDRAREKRIAQDRLTRDAV